MSTVSAGEALAVMARGQLHGVLAECAPATAAALRERLMGGRVDGTQYWRDGVGCALGTIAWADGAQDPADEAMARAVLRVCALEEWAWPIRPGDLPDLLATEGSGSYAAALLVRWIDEFEAERVSS